MNRNSSIRTGKKREQQRALDTYYSRMLQEREDLRIAQKLQEEEHRRAGHTVHVYSSYFESQLSEGTERGTSNDNEALLLQQVYDLRKELDEQKAYQESHIQNQNEIGGYLSHFEQELEELRRNQEGASKISSEEVSRLKNAHQERIASMVRTRTLLDMNEGRQDEILEAHEQGLREQAQNKEMAKIQQEQKLRAKLKERQKQKSNSSASTSRATTAVQ